MNLIKKIFLKGRALKLAPKRGIVLALAVFVFLVFLYCLVLFLNVTRAEIALSELDKSYRLEKVCHEDCSLWRETKIKLVVSDLKNNYKKSDKKIAARIYKFWQAKDTPAEFKVALIKIIYQSYGASKPPIYLTNYLKDSGANPNLVREIISSFNLNPSNTGALASDLLGEIKNATSSATKVEALKTLRQLNNDQEINNYFYLLTSTEDWPVKREAIRNISAIREKSSIFTKDQLSVLKELILSLATEARLRQELVLLLGDYYLVYPSESEAIWRLVSADKKLDSISRAFSVDSLNHLVGTKLPLPIVTPDDWANYYNQ